MSMADIARRSFEALRRVRGVALQYQRGDKSIDLVGVPGSTPFRFQAIDGGFMRTVSKDWLLLASELVIDGETVEPQRGDKIIETATELVHEVLAPMGSNEPEWRWSDLSRVVMRVHTKEVAT
jgi:hypothetical protein